MKSEAVILVVRAKTINSSESSIDVVLDFGEDGVLVRMSKEDFSRASVPMSEALSQSDEISEECSKAGMKAYYIEKVIEQICREIVSEFMGRDETKTTLKDAIRQGDNAAREAMHWPIQSKQP